LHENPPDGYDAPHRSMLACATRPNKSKGPDPHVTVRVRPCCESPAIPLVLSLNDHLSHGLTWAVVPVLPELRPTRPLRGLLGLAPWRRLPVSSGPHGPTYVSIALYGYRRLALAVKMAFPIVGSRRLGLRPAPTSSPAGSGARKFLTTPSRCSRLHRIEASRFAQRDHLLDFHIVIRRCGLTASVFACIVPPCHRRKQIVSCCGRPINQQMMDNAPSSLSDTCHQSNSASPQHRCPTARPRPRP
jgi:hypothetical protein